MTERSYYHNGCAAGDAVEAPYSAELFTKIESLVRSSGDCYVIPNDTTGSLYATRSAVGILRVEPGRAMVAGILYVNTDSVFLNIPANNSIYPRMDRIIIRVDWTTQTARLVIKTGRPAILPEPPELTQIPGELYEMALYRYYLAAGATSVAGANYESLLDERSFVYNATYANLYVAENCCPNSELMSRAERGALATATTATPAMWEFAGTPTVIEATKFDDMTRGSCIDATVTSTDYIFLDWPFSPSNSIRVTIQLYVEVLSGTLIVGNGANAFKYVDVTNGPAIILIRNEAVSVSSTFSLRLSSAGTCRFKLGQVTLTHGWVAAPFGTVHETIVYGNRRFRSLPTAITGTFSLALGNLKGTHAMIASIEASDSLSSTNNTNYVAIRDTLGTCDQLRVELGRHPNSYYIVRHGVIGLVPSSVTNPDAALQISCNATIVGTMNAYLSERGIMT